MQHQQNRGCMDKKKIAFVGEPSYDIIMYLGQVLNLLGFKLTVYDLSPLKDVVSTIPNVDFSDGVGEYQGIDIVWGNITEVQNQEYAIFYFGYNVMHPLIAKCDEVWIFTDYQIQHINALKCLNVGTIPRFLVYLSDDVGRAATRFIIQEFEHLHIVDGENFVEVENISKEFRFHCQYDNTIKYKRIPRSFVTLVHKILEVDFSKKEIDTAVKGVK